MSIGYMEIDMSETKIKSKSSLAFAVLFLVMELARSNQKGVKRDV